MIQRPHASGALRRPAGAIHRIGPIDPFVTETPDDMRAPRWNLDLVASVGIAGIAVAVHHRLLAGWWRWDDPSILKLALRYSPWQYFLAPAVWRELSTAHLMPWLPLSFDIDLALVGLSPRALYAHHLVALAIAACLTYLLLRQWSEPFWSALAAGLFLSGAPVLMTAQELSTRHYIEGLSFACLALICAVRGLRDGSDCHAWWAAACYALAVTAKEVFVPLPALLPFLPEGSRQRRLRATAPLLVVLAAYLLWRALMLGTPMGGYAGEIEWGAVLALPLRAMGGMLGRGPLALASALGLLALAGVRLRQRRHLLPLLAATGAAIVGPLLPVARFVGDEVRYLVIAWWGLCVAIGCLFAGSARERPRARIWLLAIFATVLWASLQQTSQIRAAASAPILELETQGRFLWATNEPVTLVASPVLAGGLGYARDLVSIREMVGRPLPAGFRIVVDEIELEQAMPQTAGVWAYAEACRCVQEISPQLSNLLAAWRTRRRARPLSIAVTATDGVISWHFGPYEQGTYTLVNGDWLGKLALPARGRWRLALPGVASFYLRYDSPDGWITYSPRLTFAPARERSLRWERRSGSDD